MATIQDLFFAMQNGVQAINNLRTQIATSFPPITTLSTTVPAVGTATFSSSQPQMFGLVQTSSGGTYRIPLYPSS